MYLGKNRNRSFVDRRFRCLGMKQKRMIFPDTSRIDVRLDSVYHNGSNENNYENYYSVLLCNFSKWMLCSF